MIQFATPKLERSAKGCATACGTPHPPGDTLLAGDHIDSGNPRTVPRASAPRRLFAASSGALLLLIAAGALAADQLAPAPQWQQPTAAAARKQVFEWLDAQQPDAETRARAERLWDAVPESPSGEELLEAAAQTFALTEADVRTLVETCAQPRKEPVLPSHAWLADAATPPLVSANLRLYYGRWLAHQTLYDEAAEQLAGLKPGDVVDPASLLFYQAVVHHRLLEKEKGLQAARELLADGHSPPRRYTTVARLIEADLKDLEPETLDHIARRMEDIQRRLDLGRAGPKVRKIEDGVIESLDKLISELEQQQQKSASMSSGGQGSQSQSPLPDSRIAELKGRGEVTKRNIGSEAGWGDLPPREREEVLQQIGREFPSHYRDVIEQYFRKLAAEGSQTE